MRRQTEKEAGMKTRQMKIREEELEEEGIKKVSQSAVGRLFSESLCC